MKTSFTRFGILILVLSFVSVRGAFGQITIFSDNFESGIANKAWGTYYKLAGVAEDTVKAKAIAQVPKPLTGGGNFVGWLQDINASYTGSAVSVAGSKYLKDYSIEADVYCYVGQSLSAYSGLVVYADSAKKDFYKLRVDFDVSDRINFSGLKSDTNTFLPLFSKDFKGSENPGLFPTTDGWHKLKVEVRNTSPTQTSFWCYFDGTLLKGCPIIDSTSGRNTSGQFGLYSFQQSATGLAAYYDNIVVKSLPTPVDFSENFESGKANAAWGTYYVLSGVAEDTVKAKPMAQVPKSLSTGGSYVGWLQDINASYTGSAVSVAGSLSLHDYSVEADVYCYVNQSLSAYSGLVVYADSAQKDFYKLRVDFDVSDRINLSGLKSDTNTFLPLFSKDFKGSENPGLFPTTDSWHKLKIEVRNTSATQTSFWCYFDGTLLKGCPIIDSTSTRVIQGQFGLYSFQQSATGLASYFDNISVKSLSAATAVEDQHKFSSSIPTEFSVQQNYPNPFNPTTKISFGLPATGNVDLRVYDMLGREVAVLATGTQLAGFHTVTFNAAGLSSGIYFYRLTTATFSETKKMLLVK
jgi:hypothetical protein